MSNITNFGLGRVSVTFEADSPEALAKALAALSPGDPGREAGDLEPLRSETEQEVRMLQKGLGSRRAHASAKPLALGRPVKVGHEVAICVAGSMAAFAMVQRRGNDFAVVDHRCRTFYLRSWDQEDVVQLTREVAEFVHTEKIRRVSICQLSDQSASSFVSEQVIITAIKHVPKPFDVEVVETETLRQWVRANPDGPAMDGFSVSGNAQLYATRLAQFELTRRWTDDD